MRTAGSVLIALGILGSLSLPGSSAAQPQARQKFVPMNAQVERFLTGPWVKTAAPADRPPTDAEVIAAASRCGESMIDAKAPGKGMDSLFPSDAAAHGDISMFRSDGAFILAERQESPTGGSYPYPKKMNVSAVDVQGRIIVRFVSHGFWTNGEWIDQLGAPALWGDAMLGDLDIGGMAKHMFVLGRDNNQTTYVKCEP